MVKLKAKKCGDVSGAVFGGGAKMRRRSNLEMDFAILNTLSNHKLLRKTHIMYRSNVNANILNGKLVALEARGLIESHKIHKRSLKQTGREPMLYGLTAKGLEVLRRYLSAYDALGCVE